MDTMLTTLTATGPFPELADELSTFGRFVGAWDVDLLQRRPDGTTERLRGEWHFGWALGGRAIVDVWRTPGRDHGVTVRFYDPSIGGWRNCWSGPVVGRQVMLIGRDRGDEIVLEGEEGGTQLRWVFSDIGQSAFRWRALASTDGGRTWRVDQEMTVTRAASPC